MTQTDPLFDIAGRVALVTGATSGLGERFARMLSSRGAYVVATGRRAARLEALVDELGADRTRAIVCDVTDEAAVVRAVQQAADAFGRLDIMVNNAGASDGGPAEREDLSTFQAIIDLNVAAVFTGSREAAKAMLAQGQGSIINIASIAGFVSLSERHRLAAYTASKHAVVGLTRELAGQWGRKGVRVNAIAPGWFPTHMSEVVIERNREVFLKSIPLGRFGGDHDLKGAAAFLSSDASDFVTGHVLVVDGGQTA